MTGLEQLVLALQSALQSARLSTGRAVAGTRAC